MLQTFDLKKNRYRFLSRKMNAIMSSLVNYKAIHLIHHEEEFPDMCKISLRCEGDSTDSNYKTTILCHFSDLNDEILKFPDMCKNGDLDSMIKYIKSHDYVWVNVQIEYIFAIAAVNNHLKIMKYLKSLDICCNIYIFDKIAFRFAVNNNFLSVVKYFISLDVDDLFDISDAISLTIENLNQPNTIWTHLIKCEDRDQMKLYLDSVNDENKYLDSLKFLISVNREIDLFFGLNFRTKWYFKLKSYID